MTLNSCGKQVYIVSEWDFLRRFLMLGAENGTYYISEKDLTNQHLSSLEKLISNTENHSKLVDIINEHIDQIYKKDYLIYLMARCCAQKSSPDFRKQVYDLLPKVCTIPTNLFMFIEFYESSNKKLHNSTGWNNLHKTIISKWYNDKDPANLIYLVTKYKNRNKWTNADVLRLCHVKKPNTTHDQIYKYVTKGFTAYTLKTDKNPDILTYITAYEKLKTIIDPTDPAASALAIDLIKTHHFVREHVPTCLLNNADIWNELAQNMPMVAMLRNINKMTTLGLFSTYPETLNKLVDRLTSEESIQKSKVHPLQILISLKMYSSGRGMKGDLKWSPISKLTAALNVAFKLAFKNTESTGKRYLLALDVSGSMTGETVSGIDCMMASEVACGLAMIFASVEKECDIMAFSNKFCKLDLDPNDSLENNLQRTYHPNFGSTDCSLPMTWSMQNNKKYDAMIVFTDSETNCNSMTPSQALQQYRRQSGIYCKLIVVAFAANSFTLADPEDPFGMLDIAGFSADTPNIIKNFVNYQYAAADQIVKTTPEAPPEAPKLDQNILDYYEVAKYIDENKADKFYSSKLSAKKRLMKFYHNKLSREDFNTIPEFQYANKMYAIYISE